MSELLKVGVKAANGTAVPMAADNNGIVQTGKNWVIDTFKLFDAMEIRDRNWHRSHGNDTGALGHSVDCSNYGFLNFRVRSSIDQPCELTLCTDYNSTANDAMTDSNANKIVFNIPANMDGTMSITPQDVPALNCMRWLKMYVTCKGSENPTSGTFTVDVYCKR